MEFQSAKENFEKALKIREKETGPESVGSKEVREKVQQLTGY